VIACGLGVLLLGADPALAERAELPPITEANGNHFIGAFSVAVDGSNDLWVADKEPEPGAVYKFNFSGGFLAENTSVPWYLPVGVAFSNASQHLYVSEWLEGNIWGLEPSGAYAGKDFTGPWDSGCCEYVRIAADNSGGSTGGDLYIAGENGSVYRVNGEGNEAPFSASSEPYVTGDQLTGFGPGTSFSGPVAGLAVDPAGDLYVGDGEAVYEFESTGKLLRAFSEVEGSPLGEVSAVAIDPTNGHVLIAAGGAIDEFSSTGAQRDREAQGWGRSQRMPF
jgi:DNA-binding beta-propeller fold protein YncE